MHFFLEATTHLPQGREAISVWCSMILWPHSCQPPWLRACDIPWVWGQSSSFSPGIQAQGRLPAARAAFHVRLSSCVLQTPPSEPSRSHSSSEPASG